MEAKYRYEFDSSTGIMFKYYSGLITYKEIEHSWMETFRANILRGEIRGFVLDFQEAELNIDKEEVSKIAQFYHSHLDYFKGTKIATISVTPEQVVVSTLVAKKDNGYTSRPFSTIEAAIDWVLN